MIQSQFRLLSGYLFRESKSHLVEREHDDNSHPNYEMDVAGRGMEIYFIF